MSFSLFFLMVILSTTYVHREVRNADNNNTVVHQGGGGGPTGDNNNKVDPSTRAESSRVQCHGPHSTVCMRASILWNIFSYGLVTCDKKNKYYIAKVSQEYEVSTCIITHKQTQLLLSMKFRERNS